MNLFDILFSPTQFSCKSLKQEMNLLEVIVGQKRSEFFLNELQENEGSPGMFLNNFHNKFSFMSL